MWQVVGGAERGGVLVYQTAAGAGPTRGRSAASELAMARLSLDRLSSGALIRELALVGKRLKYELVEGSGPKEGWVSARMHDKDLVVRRGGADPSPSEPSNTAAHAQEERREPPLSIGLLFPGQGSQYLKMLDGVKDLPPVRELLARAKAVLGWDVLELCLNGPEERLAETKNCQPVMFVAGLAALEKLRMEREEAVTRAQCMAGLSLGEYTALCAAGVFTFEDGLSLVKLRGEAMQDAASVSKQLMLSVAGLPKEKVEGLCAEAAKREGPGAVCVIANVLFPAGFSCAGTAEAVTTLKALAEDAGALSAKFVKTSGAFHTSLMQPAAERLGAALDALLPSMKPPKHTVWMNANAEPVQPGTDPKDIVALMKRQLTSSVLWEPSAKAMIAEGISEFYEVGPMKQIKAMMKRIDQGAWKATTNVEV